VSGRKLRLVDCNPRWIDHGVGDGRFHGRGIQFDCPEGHEHCWHSIPFTPALDGTASTGWYSSGAVWQRTGDTFETLTLSASIARRPQHASREAAIASGCRPEYVTESLLCAFHGFIRDGGIEFCGDSR
jgi:hypothetical protein